MNLLTNYIDEEGINADAPGFRFIIICASTSDLLVSFHTTATVFKALTNRNTNPEP